LISAMGGKRPKIHDGAFVHEAAVVIGDVVIEEGANIWPNAVIRGDIEQIHIGKGCSIQDGAIIHTDPSAPVTIGEGTTVAHGCIIHGCKVGSRTLIGMGAIVLTGAEIGDECIIGAGAVVPEGKKIPCRSIAMGIPAKVIRDANDSDIMRIQITTAAYLELAKKYR